MVGSVLSAAFAVCAFNAALFGFLSGMRKKWQLTLMKIINSVLAVFIAVLLASLISWNLTGYLLPYVSNHISGDIGDLYSVFESDAVSDSAKAIVSMFIAPLIFCPLFIISKMFLSIFKKPIARLLVKAFEKNEPTKDENAESQPEACENEESKEKAKPKDKSEMTAREKRIYKKKMLRNERITWASSLLGVLSGLLFAYILAIPAVCGLTLVAETAMPIVRNIEGEYAEIAVDVTEGVADNAASFTMKFFGGQLAYNQMTTYKIDGHKASLKNEANFIATASNAAMLTSKIGDDYNGDAVRTAFKNTGDAFKTTTIAPAILPEVLSQAKDKWDNGETFCGVPKPSIGEDFDPVVEALIDILGGENYDTIKADVATVFNIFGLLVSDIDSIQSDPLALLGDKETVKELFDMLYESERLYKIVPAFAECGIELMSSALGIHEDLQAHYNRLNEDLSQEINRVIADHNALGEQGNAEELTATLSSGVKDIFDNYGIDVKKESADVLAQAFVLAFNGIEANADQVASMLAGIEIEVIGEDEVTVTKTKIYSEKAFADCTQLRVAEDIKINYDKPADVKAEAEMLAESFVTVSALASKLQSEDLTVKTIIVDLGRLLDCFHETHTIGAQSTRNLLMCMLQSEEALSTLKIHLLQVTHLTQHICESADNDSYSVLLSNVVHMVDIIESATNNENIEEEIKELINNLTPSTATTIKEMATPETLKNYGVPDHSAEQTSELVTSIFGNLSDAKENNTLTEEKFEAEAKAVTDMMNIAMTAAKADSGVSIFGEESSTGITATDYIDRVLGSEVISHTIVEVVYDDEGNATVDPLNASIDLTDNERTELVEAMNNHLSAADDAKKEETTKQLVAAAALLNITINVNESGVIEIPTELPDVLPDEIPAA